MLNDTFDLILNYGYIGKKYKNNWYGKNEWLKLEFNYISNNETLNWNKKLQNPDIINFRKEVINNLDINENNMYLIKCLTIPVKHKFSVIKLMQIAFNIGQLKAIQDSIDNNIIDEFYYLKLDKIETYV